MWNIEEFDSVKAARNEYSVVNALGGEDAAKPTRLYLIGLDGRVVYAGGLGPYGFSPGALSNAIQDYLTSIESESHLEPMTGD